VRQEIFGLEVNSLNLIKMNENRKWSGKSWYFGGENIWIENEWFGF